MNLKLFCSCPAFRGCNQCHIRLLVFHSNLLCAWEWTSPSPSQGAYSVIGSCPQVCGSSHMQADCRDLAEPGSAWFPLLSSWCQGMWVASFIHPNWWHQHVLHTGTEVILVMFVTSWRKKQIIIDLNFLSLVFIDDYDQNRSSPPRAK